MKITKEDFNKLSKNKQKEFKERISNVKLVYDGSIVLTYIWWSIYIIAFFFIVIPLWKLAFPSEILSILNLFITLLRLMWLVICVGVAIDLINIFSYFFRKNKIRNEYFYIEVKPKNETNK
jgi:hypothetical protein